MIPFPHEYAWGVQMSYLIDRADIGVIAELRNLTGDTPKLKTG